ncbi:MAG: PLP-dependent aminotransferase family protein [Pseudomonadota bacterium]
MPDLHRASANAAPAPDWADRFTPAAARGVGSEIREMLNLVGGDVVSFAGGVPNPDLFPGEVMAEESAAILSDASLRTTALQYAVTEGYGPLREWIAGYMRRKGVVADIGNIIVTSGAQQALELVARALAAPGDRIVTSAPSYVGALQIFQFCGAEVLSVPMDEEGVLPDAFENALKTKPKFAYFVTDFANPSGVTFSAERRAALSRIAKRYGAPIVEDAAYSELYFDAPPPSPMSSIAQQQAGAANDDPLAAADMIYLGTFSKTMTPGLRVGWMTAPKALIAKAVQLKQSSDLHSGVLNQMLTARAVEKIFDRHTETLRAQYAHQRDAMTTALRRWAPQSVRFADPEGGMFVWLELPEGYDARRVLERCIKDAKMAFVPGAPFFTTPGEGCRYCRLSFSTVSTEKIGDAIKRFGDLLRDMGR